MEEGSLLLERRNCPICLEECKLNSKILPCKHQIHSECLQLQLNNSNILKCAECSVEYKFLENGKIVTNSNCSKYCIIFCKNYTIFCKILEVIVKCLFNIFNISLFVVTPIYSIINIIITGKFPNIYQESGNETISENITCVGLGMIVIYITIMLVFLGAVLFMKFINILMYKIVPYFANVEINLENLEDIVDQENLSTL